MESVIIHRLRMAGGGVGEVETFEGSHYFRGNGGVSIVVCVGVKITQPYPKGLSSIKILN